MFENKRTRRFAVFTTDRTFVRLGQGGGGKQRIFFSKRARPRVSDPTRDLLFSRRSLRHVRNKIRIFSVPRETNGARHTSDHVRGVVRFESTRGGPSPHSFSCVDFREFFIYFTSRHWAVELKTFFERRFFQISKSTFFLKSSSSVNSLRHTIER